MAEPSERDWQPRGDYFQQEMERLETDPWRAPRGPKTRFFAWVILIVFGACVLGLIAILVAEFSGAATAAH